MSPRRAAPTESVATRGAAPIEESWILASNDVLVNVLVIVAGILAWWSAALVPDLLSWCAV